MLYKLPHICKCKFSICCIEHIIIHVRYILPMLFCLTIQNNFLKMFICFLEFYKNALSILALFPVVNINSKRFLSWFAVSHSNCVKCTVHFHHKFCLFVLFCFFEVIYLLYIVWMGHILLMIHWAPIANCYK